MAVLASWNIEKRVREYFIWLLVLQTGVMGVFTALDFVLFFLFWELELIPMFFLIAIWGSGRKEYSAMKFLIFTILGSAFMLVGILALFFSTGTFDMTELPAAIQAGALVLPAGLIFLLLFVGFAVKLPVWPLHTWLPDAHTDAPTAASVMLAGVLIKMGGYGMIRVSTAMFPDVISDVAWLLAAAGAMNVLYGAVVTMRQTDLKRLIAFSSVSHMGFVLLGISSVVGVGGAVSPVGLTGASLQMFTHGTITGLLFLLVGLMYEKAHTRYIPGPRRARHEDALPGDRHPGGWTRVAWPAGYERVRVGDRGVPGRFPGVELAHRRERPGPRAHRGVHTMDDSTDPVWPGGRAFQGREGRHPAGDGSRGRAGHRRDRGRYIPGVHQRRVREWDRADR